MPGGFVVQIENSGLGIIRDATEQRDHAFTFDKIEGYAGECATELGLRQGRQVRFDLDDASKVVATVTLL